MGERVFSMIPGPPAPSIVLWCLVMLLAALALLAAYCACTMNRVSFVLSQEGLLIKAPLYGKLIPSKVLRKEEAQVLDLTRDAGRRPAWRTNGMGLPGYLTGWYTLKNGEKALLFLTGKSCVVYVPTTEGYSLLLSVNDAEGFVRELRQ
jgi:hypothetical protein